MIDRYLSYERWLLAIICSAVLMLVGAVCYDLWVGVNACIICWIQRLILLFLVLFSTLGLSLGWYKGIVCTAITGFLLDLRHIYVVLFPKQASQCMPLDFLMQMPVGEQVRQILKWVSELGRDCALEIDTITYILIVVLFVYYLSIIAAYYRLKNNQSRWSYFFR